MLCVVRTLGLGARTCIKRPARFVSSPDQRRPKLTQGSSLWGFKNLGAS